MHGYVCNVHNQSAVCFNSAESALKIPNNTNDDFLKINKFRIYQFSSVINVCRNERKNEEEVEMKRVSTISVACVFDVQHLILVNVVYFSEQ